ncbi:MAG: hypothetical protein J3K34DRAFT_454916 [Monoraphidium minutum]|nr:MAG: hypothetical protein J3K34DRAFT_454916 [Monoraphidium minutum]
MALRTLVTGSDMCSAGGDGAGPSNAVGALVNQLLGGGKTQEQLRDLPVHHAAPQLQHVPLTPEAAAAAAAMGPSGMAMHGMPHGAMGPGALDAILGGAPRMAPPPPGADVAGMVAEFEQMQRAGGQPFGPQPPGAMPLMPGAPPGVAQNLRAFVSTASSRAAFPPQPGALPPGALSVPDQCRIRDRSTILARQLYAEQGQGFADSQVSHLLVSLAIDPGQLPGGLAHVHDAAWHGIWQQQNAPPRGPLVAADVAAAQQAAALEAVWREQQHQAARPWQLPHVPSTGWANEFEQQQQQAGPAAGPQSWAEEFSHGEGERWAGEFEAAAAAAAAPPEARAADAGGAMEATRRMVEVLGSDADPKMRQSRFLQFLSKMSRGELLLEEGGLKEVDPAAAAAARQWADEFDGRQAAAAAAGQQQRGGAGASWAEDFAAERGGGAAMAGAAPGQQRARAAGDWVDEFARGVADLDIAGGAEQEDLDAAWAAIGSGAVPLGGAEDWVREFGGGDAVPEEWDALYRDAAARAGVAVPGLAGREYAFTDPNPFLGDAAALAKGKDLFRRGLLTEAALALEAEVRANPEHAEAWRLLGTVHAENDDDQRAIAAMGKALGADPSDLGVLLSLGVSHTNELDQAEAVTHLSRWLAAHPSYAAAAASAGPPPDSSQLLSHTLRAFRAAAGSAPSDPELLIATGVLHHLGRDYDGAIGAFRAALELAPGDYSLWNKLGATLANHSHSGEAISAYQRALDLKPNYMRAWTNMGVAYANLGDYTRSAAFYARALALNPAADHVWGYLRTSLACAGQADMLAAADRRDLAALQSGLPL